MKLWNRFKINNMKGSLTINPFLHKWLSMRPLYHWFLASKLCFLNRLRIVIIPPFSMSRLVAWCSRTNNCTTRPWFSRAMKITFQILWCFKVLWIIHSMKVLHHSKMFQISPSVINNKVFLLQHPPINLHHPLQKKWLVRLSMNNEEAT